MTHYVEFLGRQLQVDGQLTEPTSADTGDCSVKVFASSSFMRHVSLLIFLNVSRLGKRCQC